MCAIVYPSMSHLNDDFDIKALVIFIAENVLRFRVMYDIVGYTFFSMHIILCSIYSFGNIKGSFYAHVFTAVKRICTACDFVSI